MLFMGVVGAAGAGKTLFAKLFQGWLMRVYDEQRVVTLSMDGYHFSNASLEQMRLLSEKGLLKTIGSTSFLRDLLAIQKMNILR